MRRSLDLLADRRVYLPRHAALAELRADIVRAAYVEGDFTLTGGLRRSYYFDKYLFETRPALLRRLSRFLADLVPRETDRLAAPALGAVALGTAVSLELGLPLVIVRPQSGQVGSQRPEERAAHALFERWAVYLGLSVRTDAVGNTFAELTGEAPGPARGFALGHRPSRRQL